MFNIKPIFNFKANTFMHAFILNAICASLTAVAAIRLHEIGNNRKKKCEQKKFIYFCNFYKNNFYKTIATIIGTFITTLIVYLIMNIHIIFVQLI